jgi:two-component system, OmpR family, phosphate regulon response regulator PhoB
MSKNQNKLSLVPNNEPNSKLIMILDNTQDILDLFELLLTDAGYRVSLHYYNKRDLQEVKQLMPDLIISDHEFNDQNAGWQFLEKLKTDQQTQNIPVIVCTAVMDIALDIDKRLAKLGIRGLAKPFKIDKLLTLIQKLLH